MRKIYLEFLTSEKLGIVEEDGVTKEIVLDRPEQKSMVGNIYIGKVTNVAKSLQAAFVSYGEGKTGFLARKELPEARKHREKPIESLLTDGQEIIVQVTKEAYQEKGAVLTANITFPGIHLVYLPYGGYVAVSKKIDQAQSLEWKKKLSSRMQEEEGAIIRTSAAGISSTQLDQEFEQLRASWRELERKNNKTAALSLLFEDRLIPDRLLRKYAGQGIEAVVCDEPEAARSVRKNFPLLSDAVSWKSKWESELPEGINQLLEKSLNPYVQVPGGAEIIVEQTEAMAVIDVNSRFYLRKTTKHATSLQVNLAAVTVIAREIRRRNLSGMIVIDFITMQSDTERKQVLDAMKKELQQDPVRTETFGFTAMGLLEMTRKRELPSIYSTLSGEKTNKKPELSSRTKAYQLERELFLRLRHDSEAILLDVHPEVYEAFRAVLPMSRLVEKMNQTVYSRVTGETDSYHFRLEGTSELVNAYIQSKSDEVIDKLF